MARPTKGADHARVRAKESPPSTSPMSSYEVRRLMSKMTSRAHKALGPTRRGKYAR